MDLEASLWFLTVVKTGSFSKAAIELKVPTSTVSRRLAKLESQLGTTLLVRNTRNMHLTHSGREFLELVQQLEMNYLALKDWKNNQSTISGTLRITAPVQFINWPLSDWIIEFKLTYPDLDIQLVGSNEVLDFFERKIDLAFRQGPLSDSDLKQRCLFKIQYGIFASQAWIDSNEVGESLEWLQTKRVINVGSGGRGLPWVVYVDGKLIHLNPNTGLLLESPKHAIDAAVAGLGMAYAPYFYASDAIETNRLVPVCKKLWPTEIGFYVVFQEFRKRSNTLSTFIDFVFEKQRSLQHLTGIYIP